MFSCECCECVTTLGIVADCSTLSVMMSECGILWLLLYLMMTDHDVGRGGGGWWVMAVCSRVVQIISL